jgi:hypothetical protein
MRTLTCLVCLLFLSVTSFAGDISLSEKVDRRYSEYHEVIVSKMKIDIRNERYLRLKIDDLDSGACYLPGIYVYGQDGIKRFWPLTDDGSVSTKTGEVVYDLSKVFPKGINGDAEVVLCFGHTYPAPKTAYNKRAVISDVILSDKKAR